MKKLFFVLFLIALSLGCDDSSRGRNHYAGNDSAIDKGIWGVEDRCYALERRVQELEKEVSAMRKAEKGEGK